MNAIEILCDANRGIYIPQLFAEEFDEWDIEQEDKDILLAGPCHELYWDAWNSVLDYASLTVDGNVYTLYHDGDLFAVCAEKMTDKEYEDFYGESR